VSLKPSGSVTPLKFMRLVPLAAPKCAKTMYGAQQLHQDHQQPMLDPRAARHASAAHTRT
jgi:hypothetical protein